MTDKIDKIRALRYALAYVVFEEVGMGPDINLPIVKTVTNELKYLCESETGTKITHYDEALNLLKDSIKTEADVQSIMPYFMKLILQEAKNE